MIANIEGLENAQVVKIPKVEIVPVDGMLIRNNTLVPDDGGVGEIATQAIKMPDGRLEIVPEWEYHLVQIKQDVADAGAYGLGTNFTREIEHIGLTRQVLLEVGFRWVRQESLFTYEP